MSTTLHSLIWPLLALLLGGLQITAAALLLRERGSGPWLMMIGGVIGLVGHIAILITSRLPSSYNTLPTLLALSSFVSLGSLLFGIGLLLHVLRRRALGNRIAELEAILAARMGE